MPGLDVIPLAVSPEANFRPTFGDVFEIAGNFALSVFWSKNFCKVFWADFAMTPKQWYKILSKV